MSMALAHMVPLIYKMGALQTYEVFVDRIAVGGTQSVFVRHEHCEHTMIVCPH